VARALSAVALAAADRPRRRGGLTEGLLAWAVAAAGFAAPRQAGAGGPGAAGQDAGAGWRAWRHCAADGRQLLPFRERCAAGRPGGER